MDKKNSPRFLQDARSFAVILENLRMLANLEHASMTKFFSYGIESYINEHIYSETDKFVPQDTIEIDFLLNFTKFMDELFNPPSPILVGEVKKLMQLIEDVLDVKPLTLLIEERTCLARIHVLAGLYVRGKFNALSFQSVTSGEICYAKYAYRFNISAN